MSDSMMSLRHPVNAARTAAGASANVTPAWIVPINQEPGEPPTCHSSGPRAGGVGGATTGAGGGVFGFSAGLSGSATLAGAGAGAGWAPPHAMSHASGSSAPWMRSLSM